MPKFFCLLAFTALTVAGCGDQLVDLPQAGADQPSPARNRTAAVAADSSATTENAPMDQDAPKIRVIDSEKGYNRLNLFERQVLIGKGTERAFVGKYTDLEKEGTYICRRCNAALYKSDSKFHSGCGWPSFDDEIEGAVKRLPDIDGLRTEIVCKNCDGHLGHVFLGERLTAKNTRHCVNSVSMNFIPEGKPLPAKLVLRSKLEEQEAEAAGKP